MANAKEAKPKPLQQPLIVPDGENSYLLVRDYEYVWRDDLLRHRLRIPCGDQHDGASVPRLAWTFAGITPDGLIRAAALVHDWLYKWKGCPPVYWQAEPTSDKWERTGRKFKRIEADRLVHPIMREAGVGAVKAWIAYRGVRFGGWLSWR